MQTWLKPSWKVEPSPLRVAEASFAWDGVVAVAAEPMNNTGSANLVRNYATYAFVNPFYTSAAAKLGINTHENSRSFAIFAQDTFTPAGFDDKLHLTLGMRYTDDNKGGVRVTDTVAGASGLALKEIATKRFDPAATIGYDLTDLNQVYLRYSRAYKAGGYNLTSSAVGTPPAVINFGNEQNQSIEIGSKNEFFDRKVRLNVAAFYSMLKNLQMNVFKVPDGAPVGTTPQSFTINAPGTTKTYGVEVELNAVVAPGLTVGVNYAYLHQKIPTITPAIDPAVVANGTTVLTPAIYFPSNAPRHSISGSIDYETSVGIGTAYLHLDGAYTSMFNTTNRQGENLYLVPRRLAAINGRVGIREIELGMGKLNLSVYANNLTNTQQVATTSGRSDVFWMPPRTYGVQATVSF